LSYAADDEFRPYGSKTEAQLQARLPGLLATLTHMLNADALVVACNTASTTALPSIRGAVNIPVIGVVPAIKPAAEISQTRAIGVLGTPGTVRRKYVDDLITDFAPDCHVLLQGSDVDAVVLACTHFPLLRDELHMAVKQSVKWIDSGAAIARRLETVLAELPQKALPTYEQMAFLIGPDTDAVRARAFADYGFEKTVGLLD